MAAQTGGGIIGRKLHIAFYAPLKAAGHPVPSGDRLMARLLIGCLERSGHQVNVMSTLRAYVGHAEDAAGWTRVQTEAGAERERIGAHLSNGPRPDLWFCYHPYYKSPDLIGPVVSRRFGLAYVTCEASYSDRRNIGVWTEMQKHALDAVRAAALNLCLTQRDMQGLRAAAPDARLARFAPFIATDAFRGAPAPRAGHIVCVAMMRAGDKFESYQRLAATLAHLPTGLDWHLSVAGDGPMRAGVQALFAHIPPARIKWLGQLAPPAVAALLATGSVYVWPGCGEAYGLAYLEAQAAGLPVIAQRIAGVPEVVVDGVTGILTEPADHAAAAAAIARILGDRDLQWRMGQAARSHVETNHVVETAARRLDAMLQDVVDSTR
jgi:glycosyltransferase involved in cell wall biosynthesis